MCVVVAGKLRRCSRIASREYFKLVIVWNSLAWTLSIWWYEHFFNIQFRVLFSVLNISSMVWMFCFDFFLARIFFAPSPFSVWIFRSFSSSLNQLHDFYGVLLWGIPIFHNFQVRSLLYITENQDYAIKKSFFKIDPNWLIRITWKKKYSQIWNIYTEKIYFKKEILQIVNEDWTFCSSFYTREFEWGQSASNRQRYRYFSSKHSDFHIPRF